MIALSEAQRTACDLETFVSHADALHQRHHEACTTPFPQAPRRWLSPYHFLLRSLALTPEGDVEGGLSWLAGATIDCSVTRAICAPHYGARGSLCYDPASLVVLEGAAVDSFWLERLARAATIQMGCHAAYAMAPLERRADQADCRAAHADPGAGHRQADPHSPPAAA
jgi:hypothetical protein